MNILKYYTLTLLFSFLYGISFSQNPEINGEWSAPIPFDIVPVAIANLPDGRILTWSSKSKLAFGGGNGFTWTQIYDPSIGTNGGVLPETVTQTNHDMFCPGINNLADGRIMATGGSSAAKTTIYNPETDIWEAAPNMVRSRGYQGAVTLADGSVFTIGGSWSGGRADKEAEVWTEDLGWTLRTGLPKELLWNANDAATETTSESSYRLDNHAWLWAAPNGKIFHAGPGETMHWFDVAGNGSSTVVGQRGDDVYSMNGATVMFDVGKILKFGGSISYSGGTPSSDNAYVIDINDENNVTVTATANNAEEGRIFPSAVVLPNGEVMILGGMETSVPFSDNGAHLSAEIYNPTTNSFRTVVDMAIPRTYHSAGILMQDGRVFMGGGGLCNTCNTNHPDAEIYSPPYLFNSSGNLAVRPTVSAPELAFYDSTLNVTGSTDITDFAFIRLSSATHSVNNEQRRVPVTFTGSNGNYQIDMPNANLMPPGNYMLFALNANGVPSISETVLVADANIDIEDNLALNKPTLQSSTGFGGDSFKGVDGNTSGAFNNNTLAANSVTHTAANNGLTPEWWRVDLGDTYEYDLSMIRIYNRDDFQNRLIGAIVYVGNIDSTDPADYTAVGTLGSNSIQILTQNIGVARYVMVRQENVLDNKVILSMAELQVYGTPINCPVAGTACNDGDPNTANDVEDGNCNCSGSIPSCDDLQIVYDINNGESGGSGDAQITVSEGDDVELSLNFDTVSYTVTDPNNTILGSNVLNDIALAQSGTYTLKSTFNEEPNLGFQNPTLLFVSSEETVLANNSAINALDGNPNTIWHSQYSNNPDTPYPHEIQLDLGSSSLVSGFTYLPRPAGVGADQNGRVANFEIYVSDDSNNWGTAVSTGTWANTIALKTVNFTAVQGRYLRFVALSEVNGQPWASAAEINVLRPGPSVLFVDSEELINNTHPGEYAIDGNPNTFWHTQWSNNPDTPYPHEIQIDLGLESLVSGIEYLPRQVGANGRIGNYEIYVSNDPANWGTAVASGTWPNNANLQTVNFTETLGRYVRLLALSEVRANRPWAAVAELNILRKVPTECVKTIDINVDEKIVFTYNNGWLTNDPNGVANFNDTILIESGEAVISMNTEGDDISVDPGASLTVNSGVTLTTKTTTLKSTSQLYSSLIADGTVEGTIKYERYVNANNGGNDLISPPLAGETWADFLLSDNNANEILNDGNDNPRTYLFGPFDKTVDGYVNYTDGEVTNLVSGKGYRAGSIAGSNLTFTGTVPTSPVNVNITDAGATFPDWNLIGNPYPSYLDMDLFLNYVLDPNTVPVTTNMSILEDISGIYGYVGNGESNKWSVITLLNATEALMTPGQGFFVAANDAFVTDYDITFDPSMRAIGNDDDFVAGRNANTSTLTYLKLNAITSNKDYTTEFYFNDNASLGLDLGYDGKILGNVAPNFALYSHLVQDNSGLPIAIQGLNPSDLTNTIIPLGVNANQGEQLTFSISDSTLPTDVEVYLEDNLTNTVTLLNSANYVLTPNANLNGTGRFYLRVTSSLLSVGTNELDYLQIYTTDNPKLLMIKGQLNASTKVNLYDARGRLVLNTAINHRDVLNTVDVSMLGTGVYIVKVSNDSQSKTQKLVIK